jgi:TRAP-type C4-dicarboxylate transport system substrate-binding protein
MRAEHASPSVDGTNKRRCTTMQTRRFTKYGLAAVLAASAMTVAACSGSSGDKAGGAEKQEPVVLKFASLTGNTPPQLQVFADEVVRRSDGTLRINFRAEWRGRDPDAERGTIEDVKAGKVDMGWVGARVFDRLGVTDFQPLLAPLLVDSYELEDRVFERGVPANMLDGVEELEVVGIGVLPGPMRKVLGIGHPFLEPSDFDGQVIGGSKNELSVRTYRALGATIKALIPGGSLEGLDAAEQQLGAIWENRYNRVAKYVTANVNLWPRPLVIFAGKDVFESLSPEQQDVLREAAAAAVPGALAAARAEDDEAALQLCRRGMTFAVASESELAELRRALEPVYAELTADPETKSNIEAITNLKTEIAAAAEAPACTSTKPPTTASPIPDGTYETTVTEADYRKAGVSDGVGAFPGGFKMIFDAGEWTFIGPIRDGEPPKDEGEKGSYTVFRDQIEVDISDDFRITARWSLQGEALTFTDVGTPRDEPNALTVIWTSHPWVKVD